MRKITKTVSLGLPDEATLVVKPETFKQSKKSGNVTGIIYWIVEQFPFPAMDWFDFPVIILSWWSRDAVSLRLGRRKTAELDFMDGPHYVIVKLSGQHNLDMSFVERTDRRITRCKCIVSADSFFKTIEDAGLHVIRVCDQNTWHSDDLEYLREMNSQLMTMRTRPP
jgi:hypothetical protein